MSGGLIVGVEPGSVAERIGLKPSDVLVSVNGHKVRDVLDVQFYSAEDSLSLGVLVDGREVSIGAQRTYGEPLGLEFAQTTFDSVRSCRNRCDFCFIEQMPKGLRDELYLRDDDYRYSFLHGNYVTLTNLAEEDWDRIAEQRLSPLYVSVHATEPALRARMLGNPRAGAVLEALGRLVDLGIEVHAQVVLNPGVNDGPHLERTISDLSGLYPGVRSVSVVPVGLTKYHRGGCRPVTVQEARLVARQVMQWQHEIRARTGVGFVYLSDEWYLRLGEPVPPSDDYDGLDLSENGVGLVRRFHECWGGTWSKISELSAVGSVGLVTGSLFAPVLGDAVRRMNSTDGPTVRVITIPNDFFGDGVTVAGLLTGEDVIAFLQGNVQDDIIALPAAMFSARGGKTLDGIDRHAIERMLRKPVKVLDDRPA
jgi:putative radical SAM enzyme (TIGR03279 family)